MPKEEVWFEIIIKDICDRFYINGDIGNDLGPLIEAWWLRPEPDEEGRKEGIKNEVVSLIDKEIRTRMGRIYKYKSEFIEIIEKHTNEMIKEIPEYDDDD